ncbi:MAG: hypothetical protein QW035_03680 [Candidatus Anstonellales archaeon]
MKAILLCILAVSLLSGIVNPFTLSASARDGIITYTIGGQGTESFTVVVKRGTTQLAVEHLDSVALPYKKDFIAVEEGLYEISVLGEKDMKKVTLYSSAFKEPDLSGKQEQGTGVSSEMLFIAVLILITIIGVLILSIAEKKKR